MVSPEFMKILEEEEYLSLKDLLKIKAIFTVQFINKFFDLQFNFGSYKLVYTIDNKFLFHIFNNHFCPLLSSIEMLERKSFHIPNFYILEIPHIIIFKLNLIMEKENEFNLKLCTKNGTRVRVFNLMYQNLYYRLIVDDRSKRIKTFFIIDEWNELNSLDKSPIVPICSDLYVLPFYKKAI